MSFSSHSQPYVTDVSRRAERACSAHGLGSLRCAAAGWTGHLRGCLGGLVPPAAAEPGGFRLPPLPSASFASCCWAGGHGHCSKDAQPSAPNRTQSCCGRRSEGWGRGGGPRRPCFWTFASRSAWCLKQPYCRTPPFHGWYLPLQTECAITSRPAGPEPQRRTAAAEARACKPAASAALPTYMLPP